MEEYRIGTTMRKRGRHSVQDTVGHGEGTYSFDHADESVGLEHEFPIDESVNPGSAGATQKDVSFGGFVGKGYGCSGVRKQAIITSVNICCR